MSVPDSRPGRMAVSSLSGLETKRRDAVRQLAGCDRVIVALSGGVDSAVLLMLALEALGRTRVVAVTGRSPSLPGQDLEDACRVARALDAQHEIVETHELERPGYRANDGNRCFHCRTELFAVLAALAGRQGGARVAYGAIKDDEADVRPGMAAARTLGVLAPLQRAGFTKADVRALATAAHLPVRDKPAAACLSSRIPIGTPVTVERLGQIERAEAALRKLGFGQLRVRHHEQVARLELDARGDALLADPEIRARVVRAVRESGFRHVAVDLEGYRTGSLNPES